MKQAAILARVSTATQNTARQLDELKILASDQGYQVSPSHIYQEQISGLTDAADMGELNRLINDIKAGGNIKMVFVHEASRISRRPEQSAEFINTLIKLKVPVYIKNMNMASMNPDGSKNQMFFLFFTILAHFAQTELEYTSARTRSGKKRNFAQGRNLGGGQLVYGYMLGQRDDERKAAKLIINPVEAPVVKLIFKMTTEGAGMKTIANYLNTQGIPTKSGKQWLSGTVNQILEKEIYYGNRSYNIYGKDDNGNRVILSTEKYEGIVPAIITKAEYEAAISASAARNVNPVRNTKYLYLLAGKVRCGYCGNLYSPKYRPGSQSHYGCSSKINNKKEGVHCPSAGIGIDKLESLAWVMVRLRYELSDFLQGNDRLINEAKNDINNLELQISSYQNEKVKRNEERLRVSNQHKKGIISDAELDEEFISIKRSLKNLDDKLAEANLQLKTKKDWLANHSDYTSITKKIAQIGVDRIKINDVLSKVFDKMIITSVGKANTDWFIATAYLFGAEGWTVVFNKKELKIYMNPPAEKMVKYDKQGLSNFNIDKVAEAFKKPYKLDKAYWDKFPVEDKNPFKYRPPEDHIYQPALGISHVPFTRLNTLDDMKPVPKGKTKPKKQYRKKKPLK